MSPHSDSSDYLPIMPERPSSANLVASKPSQPTSSPWVDRLKRAGSVVVHHARKHVGVGIVCAVAYFDPGNWGVDLQAGSQFGYHLLFVVLLADLAAHSRLLLYNRPKHTLFYRWGVLYPLYVLAEVAIIATDLAELLGSAIALCMLFPKLELWHGVLITAFDVILILGMGDPLRGKPVRMFEVLIAAMVLAVMVCMIVIISKVEVDWAKAFEGYIPSKHMFGSGAIYVSVGIVGATVMPHSLFLGSALATQDRIDFRPDEDSDVDSLKSTTDDDDDAENRLGNGRRTDATTARNRGGLFWNVYANAKESVLEAFRKPPPNLYARAATKHSEHTNNPYEFVKAHIYHGTVDIVGSLLGFAVMINSLILMLASAVFFYGRGYDGSGDPASLFDAYDLIRDIVGQGAATLFAIALLCAGQSSSIIATVAGQAVSEGFLQWRVSPIMRRFLTRLLAIIPSMAVAVAVGRDGIDALLVASQVVLSIVLPFITFPLLYCTANKSIMSVKKTRLVKSGDSATTGTPAVAKLVDVDDQTGAGPPSSGPSAREVEGGLSKVEVVDYSSNKFTIVIGAAIWLVIVAANVYAIVELAMGNGGGGH